MREASDTELMLRVRVSDEAAFEELHERYQRRLIGFFWGLTRDAVAANELAQDTFLRIWQVRLRYKASGPFAAYLFAIARMVYLEQRRKAFRLARLSDRVCEESTATPVSHTSSPAEAAEMETALFAAMETLPDEQKLAFLMHTVQGLPMEEVAAALDCPLNTARSRRILAVRKLRQVLTPFFASLTGRAVVE